MSHLLWWYLDDVLPLAEHAMACVSHRSTAEEVHAGLPQRSALVWTTTDTAHLLTSNGVPVFCDDTGQPHAAAARTWHHPATGTTGGSDHPCDGQRCWSLNRHHRDRRDPLIKILRRGARRHGHWLAVDTDPTMAASPQRFTVRDHRDDLVPPDTGWVDAKVTAASAAHLRYPALVAAGYTITGDDVIARFTREVVNEMIGDLDIARVDAMPGEVVVLRWDGPVLRVLVEHDAGHGVHPREIDRVHPDRDGRYPVGAYLWPWHQASDQPTRR